MPDHVHCLFLLNPQKTTTDVVKQIKGSSSYYINSKNHLPVKFIWQRGFGAFSVSESGKDRVFEYIKNQKKHHNKQSFDDEYIQFGQLHGFDNMELD
jgi:REP element-mobilizing transposase RayT